MTNPALASLDSFARDLSRRIWTTKGARFNGHRRLTKQNEWSLRAISFLSVYVTVLSIAILVPAFSLSAKLQAEISLGVAALSLMILVFSLLESSRDYRVRAERLHLCAMELGRIQQRVDFAIVQAGSQLATSIESLATEYEEAIRRCQENHDSIDDLMFRASYHSDFGWNPRRARWVRSTAWVRLYGLFFLAVALPPTVALVFLIR